MAKRISINRAKNKKNDNPVDKLLVLGMAFNEKENSYKLCGELWCAVACFNEGLEQDFNSYMEEVFKWDKAHKNDKRIEEYQELKRQNLSLEQMKKWADKKYQKEWKILIRELDKDLKNRR